MSSREIERIGRVYRCYSDANLGATRWSPDNGGNRQIVKERQAVLAALLYRHGYLPLDDRSVLDAGCGRGDVLAGFTRWAARAQHLYGLELLPQRTAAAQARHPDLHFVQGDAAALCFDAGRFDLVAFFTVFSSVLDGDLRQAIAADAVRVLKPGGAVIWYDLRISNPGNAHVEAVGRGQISALFPSLAPQLLTTTLLPPLARRLGKLAATLYPLLSSMPWLHTHYIGLLTST